MKKIKIAKLIKEYRRNKKITQEEFGKMIGVSPQAVSKWERENGYPDITLLPTISNLLGCTVNDFFEILDKKES